MEAKRLKKILDISKRVEKARKGELSNARHDESLALQELERAKRDERDRLQALAEAGELGVHMLQDRAQSLVEATKYVGKAREVHVESGAEVQRREQVAFEATRDVRKFEILNDRAKEERRIAQKNQEQQTLDETRRPKPKEHR